MIYVVDAACTSRFEDSKSALGNICWIFPAIPIKLVAAFVVHYLFQNTNPTVLSGFIEKVLQHEDLQGAPVLILANKQVIISCWFNVN